MTSRIPGQFDSVQDLDDIEDDDAPPSPSAGKRALAPRLLPRGKPTGKLRPSAGVIGSSSKPAETGGGENCRGMGTQDPTSAQAMQGQLRMPAPFPNKTPRATGTIKVPQSSALGLQFPPSPWNTNGRKSRDGAVLEIEPPSTPARRNPTNRDLLPAQDLLASVPRVSENFRINLNGPSISTVFSFFDDAPASPPTAARRRQRLMLETAPSSSRDTNERFGPSPGEGPVHQAPVSTGSNRNKPPKKSRFQDETDPDLRASGTVLGTRRSRGDLNEVLRPGEPMPKSSGRSGENRNIRKEAVGASTNSGTVAGEPPDAILQESTPTPHGGAMMDEAPTQAPIPTLNDELGPSSTSSANNAKKYRFQDDIDPDLLASGRTVRKPRTWLDLNASLLPCSPAPPVIVDYSSTLLTAWGRKMPNTQAEPAATSTLVQKPGRSSIAGTSAHLVLVNKRPRTRSSSPPSVSPNTPPPKRQQQEYQQPDAIDVVLRLSKDEVEDLDTSLELIQSLEPSNKRPKSDMASSPTKPVSPVRKRQRILIEAEDIIEDGPDSPPAPRRCRIPESVVPKRRDDASSSGDEVAEHTNDNIDRTAGCGTLPQSSSSQAPACTTQSVKSRRLLGPDAMRLYFKPTKSTPGPPPALKPGMINILTHHKRIVVPKDPTPPPASPPSRGYLDKGLAETVMWWKHDAQERHKRMFTEDKPILTCRVRVREFLRDDKMCFIKGPGENRSGKEGDVKVVVTDRAAEAVTIKGMTLLYEGPWFQVHLLGEKEPYRFLIGNWRIEQAPSKKGKSMKSDRTAAEDVAGTTRAEDV